MFYHQTLISIIPLLSAMSLAAVEVTPTTEKLIFKPMGYLVGTVDYATLKININISEIFDESNMVCKINSIMDEFIAKRLKRAKNMSKPNKRVIKILKENIENLCKTDSDMINEIIDVFGLKETVRPEHMQVPKGKMAKRIKERQFVVATAVGIVTSLITLFSTKTLINMANDEGDNTDELISNNNNVIDAIQNHESRLTRLESDQTQLRTHLDTISNQLVLGIQQQDMFSNIYGSAQFAENLSKHVTKIKIGLMALLNNRLSPNLITYEALDSALGKMRNKAFKAGKALMVKNIADVYQYHCDFVSFSTGKITALTHLPLYLPQNKMRFYKYLPTPVTNIGNKSQVLLSTDETYIAINSDATLYAALSEKDVHHQCRIINDIHVCKDLTILKKTKHKSCILALFRNDIMAARKICEFKVIDGDSKEFATEIKRGEIYIYLPKITTLDEKCSDTNEHSEPKKSALGYNILKINPGCRVNTENMIFTRGRELIDEEMPAITLNTSLNILTMIAGQDGSGEELERFLMEEMKHKDKFNIVDVQTKFHLKRLSAKHARWNHVYLSTGTIMIFIIIIVVFYICRRRIICHKSHQRDEQQDRRMSSLLRNRVNMDPLPSTYKSNTLSTTISSDEEETPRTKIRG